MPKLHFYDSGLVCWLLGIREPLQLSAHPLRGAIFESWAISEILKHRYAGGEQNGLYFFRDKAGLESDLLVQGRGGTKVVEIKAGQTINSDLAAAVLRVTELFAKTSSSAAATVIYGGPERQVRNGITYLPWHAIQQFDWLE